MKRTFRRLRNLGEVLLWFFFGGCAKPTVPPGEMAQLSRAAVCKLAIDKHIAESETCPEAQVAIDSDPACTEFGPLNLKCKEYSK